MEGHQKIFKAPGGIITPLIGIAAIAWLLTRLGKWQILATFIFIAGILSIYFVTRWIKQKDQTSRLSVT
jgi:membrane protein implicated in regulation of membrane protease activity